MNFLGYNPNNTINTNNTINNTNNTNNTINNTINTMNSTTDREGCRELNEPDLNEPERTVM